MTQSKNRLTAMTAIAAVLALATPAFAQDAQPAPVATAPDPLGATPPTVDPAPSTEPAPSTPTAVDPLSATTAVEAAPVTAAPATRARATPRRAVAAPAAPVRSAARAPIRSAPATAPTSAEPVEAAVNPAPLAAPIIAARPPAAAPVESPATPQAIASNDVLPIAAAGGLGLLALLGAGFALRRRKRRDEEVEYAELDEPAFEERQDPVAYAEPMREPSMTRAPRVEAPVAAAAAATPVEATAANLPDGFDLSRFGPHVQAAYRGPTEDNPSLSLKNRLRRASAMDQMARNDEPVPPVPPRPLAAATAARDTGAVVSKVRPAPNATGFILGGGTTRSTPRPVTQH